mmetsp:Transcript_33050/g.71924  ORF Transcript_33050/g.71924 Transcript_33050/m.71924 type:complete len:827 (+) Transcript_33050:94-2574(+)
MAPAAQAAPTVPAVLRESLGHDPRAQGSLAARSRRSGKENLARINSQNRRTQGQDVSSTSLCKSPSRPAPGADRLLSKGQVQASGSPQTDGELEELASSRLWLGVGVGNPVALSFEASPVKQSRVRREDSKASNRASVEACRPSTTELLEADDSCLAPHQIEELRRRFSVMRQALQRSNDVQAELQKLLERSLDRCEELRLSEAEARRDRDQQHRKWCVLDREREGLQRVAQQAQAEERKGRIAEQAALAEASTWRSWLASFLDVLLRRGARGLDDVTTSQALEKREPVVHSLLAQLSAEKSQPELQAELTAAYDHVVQLMATGRLMVHWRESGEEEMLPKDSSDVFRLEKRLAQKELAVAALEHDRRSLQGEVRRLQNVVQELRGSIRVFCRVRPARALAGPLVAAGIGARVEGSQCIAMRKPPGDRRQEFSFDRVFGQEAAQEDVYEEVAPLLAGVLDGLHLCIFAYGQTGAGKTYTLSGNGSERGIQDFAITDLLKLAQQRGLEMGVEYDASLTAVEIYNESIHDLLSQSAGAGGPAGMDLRQSRELGDSDSPSPFGSMRIPGLRSQRIRGPEDVEPVLRQIIANRHVAATAMNERSSRSHCVLSLLLIRRDSEPRVEEASRCAGVLHIVDLAGSERTKVSQAEGQQMKEANFINRSLASLADVLYALGEGTASHVPYRNSKLTYLLQEPLGGAGCKTLLFAQIAPDPGDVHESYSTLTFASRVATVQKGRLRPGGSCRGTPPRRRSPEPSTQSSYLGPRTSPPPRALSNTAIAGDGSRAASNPMRGRNASPSQSRSVDLTPSPVPLRANRGKQLAVPGEEPP